jgi:macrolide transport system ATP-binding/permease protein
MPWPPWLGRRRDAEIDEEIESHLRMAIRDRIERGEPPLEARRRALVEFGNLLRAKEETRSVWTWTALEQLATDLQIGARILWRAPALSATAVVLVALVVGGNTTIFSMVHAILAKPAPGVVADRLVTLGWVTDGEEHPVGSYPNYVDVAAASRTLTPMLAFEFRRFILTTRDGSYALHGATVSPNYFDTLAIRPIRGRTFTEREGRLEASGLVAVISHRLWRERFAESPDVVGETTMVNGHVVTIIGIAPPLFRGVMLGEGSDIWIPLVAYAEIDGRRSVLTDHLSPGTVMIGRLAPGASLSAARTEFATIARQLPRAPGDAARQRTIQLFPYSATAAGDSLVAQRGPWFLAMFSIITLLTLLIVCANVANLMLARAVVRAREMAVRQSFGASRARITRIFVAEGLAIGTVAWAGAAIFAFWTTRTIPHLMQRFDVNSSRITFDYTPDWTVFGYAMLLAVGGTALVSAAPAVRACRQDLQPLLKAGEQGVVRGRSGVSNGLVVLQLAFSVLLLTTAGLAYRSLSVLTASDLGFDKDRLLLVTINTQAAAPTGQGGVMLLAAMLERLRAVPGVSAVSYARRPVQSYWPVEPIGAEAGGRPPVAERNEVGPGYLGAMGVTALAGHDLEVHAPDRSAIAAVINQRLAAALWPGQPAVGRTLRLRSYAQPLVIAGVAPDGLYSGYRRQSDPNFVFVSATGAPPPPGEMTLYVRYAGSLDHVVPAIGRTLRALDDRAPIVYLRTMDEQLESLTWLVDALALLLALFAGASLLIATIGQYAAMAFTMRRRIRDFGVRIALGASSRDIVTPVVREGLRLTAVGLAVGTALSVATAIGLRSMLLGVTPTDARTYAGVFTLLAAASLVACYLPAYRAARIDPMQALREE